MNHTATRRFARYCALPAVAAAIIGGAALGVAGAANAGTYSPDHTPRPGIVATPPVTADPAPQAMPGTHGHDRVAHLENLFPDYMP